jgi:nucleoside-diphosphate-sugar epimerase
VQPSFEDIFGNQSDLPQIIFKDNPESILVTGAQGMLGNGIAKAFSFLQMNGILADTKLFLGSREWRPEAKSGWNEGENLQLVVNSEITKIQDAVDVVVHTASPSNITQINTFEELHYANVGILKRIEKLDPRKVIYISSGEVYKSDITLEGSQSSDFLKTNKRDWYPLVKLEAENELEHFGSRTNASIAILRLFHTFGPGVKRNDGRSFADILWGAALNNKISLHSSGEQIRSFLYLSDAVEAILRVVLSDESGYRVANLGSDKPVSIREFAEQVRDFTGSVIEYDSNSNFVHSPNDYLVPIIQNIFSYGWAPKLEIGVGIERTISWIRNSTLS